MFSDTSVLSHQFCVQWCPRVLYSSHKQGFASSAKTAISPLLYRGSDDDLNSFFQKTKRTTVSTTTVNSCSRNLLIIITVVSVYNIVNSVFSIQFKKGRLCKVISKDEILEMSAFPADEVRSKRIVDHVESMTGCSSPSSKEEARRKNEEALAAAQRAMMAAHNDVKTDNEFVSIIRKISDTKLSTVLRTSTKSPVTINSNNGESSLSTQTHTEEPVRRLPGTSLINAIRGNSNTKISGEKSNAITGERKISGTSIISALRGKSNTNIEAPKNLSNASITGERKNSGTSLINALRGNSNTNIEAPKKLSNTSMQSQLLGFNKWF